MILMKIKYYLIAHKLATLHDMACHFKMEPETIRPMLEQWVKKGKVQLHKNNSGCSKGCCQCDPATIETYEWRG